MKCPNCDDEFGACRIRLRDLLMLPLLCRPVRCVCCHFRYYRPIWFRPVWHPDRSPARTIMVATPARSSMDGAVDFYERDFPADMGIFQ
jgi:hypothetical protein